MRSRQPNPVTALSMGLLAGSACVALRGLAGRSAAIRRLGEADESERLLAGWSAVETLDAALLPGLFAGLAAALLALAGARHVGLALVALTVGAGSLAAVAGGLLEGPATRASLAGDLASDDWLLLAAFGLAAAGALAVVVRRSLPRSAAPWLLAAAAVAPLVTRYGLAREEPTFVRREVVLDFLASPELWTVLENRDDQEPGLRVITPAVSSHSDSADKPSLWMAPPCTVQLEVPAGLPPGVLRAAAGIDKRSRNRLPKSLSDLTVDFEVLVNGELAFQTRIYNERPKAGQWESDTWTWKHAGPDGDGVEVRGGDTIQLRTSLPEGHPAASLPADNLVAGFGGLVMEARIETERTRPRPDAPNLILVVQDTLRADHCSTYGYGRDTTPQLSRLAEGGMVFEAAHASSSWTWPSTASILTGLPADAHGVTSNEACTLNLSLDSVAEVLQRSGYSTAAWSCNPLIVPERYFDQGFEHFDHHPSEFRKSDEVMPAALRWIEAHAGARFFLYLHLADPHTPHRPEAQDLLLFGGEEPEGFPEGGIDALGAVVRREGLDAVTAGQRAWIRDVYDASIRTGDRWLGVLLDRLEALGLTEETVVFFTADHGEELLDHGAIGHGHSIHDELVRVPLVIAGPGIPQGMRSGSPISNRHVGATLATLGGGDLEGMGDADWLLEPSGKNAMFATTKGQVAGKGYQELYGLHEGGLVLHWWKGAEDGLWLYDAGAEPGERHDLAAERPADVERMHAELRRRLAAQRAWAPQHQVGVGDAGLQMLKGIGYLGDDEGSEAEDR